MNILEINQPDKAKRKLIKIAQNNDLDNDFVYFLFSFYWNYDGPEGDWVSIKNLDIDNEYRNRYEYIYNKLCLKDEILNKNYVVKKIYNNLLEMDIKTLKNNFLYGCMNGNYGLI
jgi:hypothetical protein